MKKILIAVVIVLIVFALAILIIGRTFYPDNVAKTSANGGEKGLKTRIYKTDLGSAVETVRRVIPTLSTYGSQWQLVEFKTADSLTTYVLGAKIPVVVFTDDLTVNLKDMGNGEIQIDIRSQSRVGKSDFGENARHVRKLLNALDKEFEEME